jgi:hypothetical protein
VSEKTKTCPDVQEKVDGRTAAINDVTDIFLIANDEINAFNLFMKHDNITPAKKNAIGAISTAIRFSLFRPSIEFDQKTGIFSLKKIAAASDVIGYLRAHMELVIQFDVAKIEQRCWAINHITPDKIQIIVKIDPETSKQLIDKMMVATKTARENGWKGVLEIIQASSRTILLPEM